MKTLARVLLLLLCAALLAATFCMSIKTTPNIHEHVILVIHRWSELYNVKLWSMLGILTWCVFFAKSEPLLVRFGLTVVIAAMAFTSLAVKAHELLPSK